jgi:hypothetical protein
MSYVRSLLTQGRDSSALIVVFLPGARPLRQFQLSGSKEFSGKSLPVATLPKAANPALNLLKGPLPSEHIGVKPGHKTGRGTAM